jgi:hypothetical protein
MKPFLKIFVVSGASNGAEAQLNVSEPRVPQAIFQNLEDLAHTVQLESVERAVKSNEQFNSPSPAPSIMAENRASGKMTNVLPFGSISLSKGRKKITSAIAFAEFADVHPLYSRLSGRCRPSSLLFV